MMTAPLLLEQISPELRQEIFRYLQQDERPAYRTVIHSLTSARKLRPQFILEKSRLQQQEWLISQLKMKANHSVIEQLLQIWLLKSQTSLLTTFLDAVGISHDGKGQVDTLPEDIETEKATLGIQALLASHPAENAKVYLHLFQLQKPGGFPGLAKAIQSEAKLN
jgi:hypothetical protein